MRILLLTALCVFLCTCDRAAAPSENNDASTTSESMPGAFDDVAAAMQNGAAPAEIASMLMENFPKVADEQTGLVNEAAGTQFTRLASALADDAPQDTVAAMPLYRAADVHKAMGNFAAAAETYARVENNYPTFSKAGEALFMLGFTYDENLKNYDMARATYEKFLAKYPNNIYANDTEMLIKNLGKSDMEVLQNLSAGE